MNALHLHPSHRFTVRYSRYADGASAIANAFDVSMVLQK